MGSRAHFTAHERSRIVPSLMPYRRAAKKLRPAALALALALSACGPRYPEVTAEQAEAALSDATMVCATSLLLVMTVDISTTSRASAPNDSMVLEWSEIDRERGIGDYTLTLTDYHIPEENIFADDYHGYRFTGTAHMSSADGRSTALVLDLTAVHADPEAFPVQRIEAEVTGITQAPAGASPGGEARVNGRAVPLSAFAELFATDR